jgi:predicted Zn finger-like uncharacterized protein
MSMAVSCPSCQKEYKVKADAAGKKFRCKACQTVVTVPQAEPDEFDLLNADPWDAVDENAPPPELPPRRVKSSSAAKPAKKRSSDGMPVTVMVSIGICGLLVAFNLFGIVANLFLEGGNKGQAGGSGLRLGIDIMIIKGLLERSNRVRWNAIILDIIGLVFMIPSLGLIIAFTQAEAANDNRAVVIGTIAISIVFWIIDLVMLTHSSARDYCNQ